MQLRSDTFVTKTVTAEDPANGKAVRLLSWKIFRYENQHRAREEKLIKT